MCDNGGNNEAKSDQMASNKGIEFQGQSNPETPDAQRLRAVLPIVWELTRPRLVCWASGFLLMVINRVSSLVLLIPRSSLIDTVISQTLPRTVTTPGFYRVIRDGAARDHVFFAHAAVVKGGAAIDH